MSSGGFPPGKPLELRRLTGRNLEQDQVHRKGCAHVDGQVSKEVEGEMGEREDRTRARSNAYMIHAKDVELKLSSSKSVYWNSKH